MCMRQLTSLATTARAPVASMASSFRSSIAPEMALIFTENRPPNPQQLSASARGRRSMCLDGIEQDNRLIPHAQPPQSVATGMVGHAFARTGATGCLAKDIHQELRELVRSLRKGPPREDRSPGHRRAAPARDAPAYRRRIPRARRRAHRGWREHRPYDAPSCAHRRGTGVERWLSAAGLSIGHEDFESGALEDGGGREAHVRIEVIDEAGHQQLHRAAASARPLSVQFRVPASSVVPGSITLIDGGMSYGRPDRTSQIAVNRETRNQRSRMNRRR